MSKPAQAETALVKAEKEDDPRLAPARLAYHSAALERFGVDRSDWRTLVEAVFPLAGSPESVLLALAYCRARKLDPFKRVVQIVPIWNKDLGRLVDTIWPGIGELRTTAARTGQYVGRDDAVFGTTIKAKVGDIEMEYPQWCQITVWRYMHGEPRKFVGPKVWWLETYATRKRDDNAPNQMWQDRPFGQLEKCAEAAALRAAFPEEAGNDLIDDEIGHGVGEDNPHQARRMQAAAEATGRAQAASASLGPSEPAPAATTPQEPATATPVPPGGIGLPRPGAAKADPDKPKVPEKPVVPDKPVVPAKPGEAVTKGKSEPDDSDLSGSTGLEPPGKDGGGALFDGGYR